MQREPIGKSPAERVSANLSDHARARRELRWAHTRTRLSVDRVAAAIDLTYGELARRTNRFANLGDHLGVGTGERVFLLGRGLTLYQAEVAPIRHALPSLCHVLLTVPGNPHRGRSASPQSRPVWTTGSPWRRRTHSRWCCSIPPAEERS